MIVHAYAKINLTLDILGKRQDGYHDLVMVMQSVGLHDSVSVKLNDDTHINLKSSSALLVDNESNTAYKAAKNFFEFRGISDKGVDIEIEKNIPMEAGMAGGSADAAAVIVALNHLCGTNYTDSQLWKIGEKVGADVPFCITGGTMLAQGKGEILSQLPQLSDFTYAPVILLCKPDIGVSTGKAYSAVDSCDPSLLKRPDTASMRLALSEQDVSGVASNLGNVFEQVLRIEECECIKKIMLEGGAIGSCMTGSGTTVFGIFDSETLAKQTAFTLSQSYQSTFVTEAVGCGCKIISDKAFSAE